MAVEYLPFKVLPIVKAHLIFNCILVLLTSAIVGLRLLARFDSGAKLWWDDYLIILAVPQGMGMLVIQGMCKCSQTPHLFSPLAS
jgi:hypothetical protein